MEYDEERSDATGSIPEYGAIFMSNTETIEECLSREVFALPYSFAHFVKQVKAGMALFLFEFETRQLFGVYLASSDGEMDIVPNGFSYSGKRFPAQVRVKPLWHCSPLSEKEFQGAIVENYFSAKKFNFGLSKDQVERLLHLFDARKLKNTPPTLVASSERLRSCNDITTRNLRISTGSSNRRLREGDEISTRFHGRFTGLTESDDLNPDILHPCPGKSSGKYDEEELMLESGFNAEEKYCHCSQGHVTDHHSSARRRRIAHGVITTDEIEGNETYIQHDSIQSPEHLKFSPDMRSNPGDGLRRNISFEHKKSDDLVHAYERSYYMGARDRPTSDYRLFLDDGVGRECEARDVVRLRPDVVRPNIEEYYAKLHAQARDSISHSPSPTSEKSKDGYNMYYRNSPLLDNDLPCTHLHTACKTSAKEMSTFDGGNKNEDEVGGYQAVNFQCGNSVQELPQDFRIDHDRELVSGVGRASGNMFATIRGSPPLNKSYGQPIEHMRTGNNRDVLETTQDLHAYVSHPISTELPPTVSKANQGLISRKIDHPSLSKFDDAVITRAIPYTHELSDGVAAFERNDHHQSGSHLNFYNLSNHRPSSNLPEDMVRSKCLGLTHGCGDQYIINRSDDQKTVPGASYVSMQRGRIAYGPLHRESHLPHGPCTTHDTVERKKGSPSHVLKSSEHHLSIDGCHIWDSPQHRGERTIQPEKNRHLIHQSKAYHKGEHLRPIERNLSSCDHNHRAPTAKRRNVFSRLSLGPKANPSPNPADTLFNNHNDPYVGSSPDQVMQMMLQQFDRSNNMAPKKLKSFKSTWKRGDERFAVREKVSRRLKERLNEDEEAPALADGDDDIISEEIQILGFKRRSEAKKSLIISDSNTGVNKCEAVDGGKETSAAKVPPKRRKLVRPDFGKKE